MRLNVYLTKCGLASRRGADELIRQGRVTVNGRPAPLGLAVTGEEEICVDGKRVRPQTERIVIALNKPRGVVCTTARFPGEQNVIDLVGLPERIFPVGRLDKDSEGLLLLTNDGPLADHIMRSRNGHEKEYVVRVDRPVTAEFLKRLRTGVDLGDAVTRPCTVTKLAAEKFRIILTQGLNRQIRRMCEVCGFRVLQLTRVRVMSVDLTGLGSGRWRRLTEEEIEALERG